MNLTESALAIFSAWLLSFFVWRVMGLLQGRRGLSQPREGWLSLRCVLRWTATCLGGGMVSVSAMELRPLASLSLQKGGGEIISYDPGASVLVSTVSDGGAKRFGLELVDLSQPSSPRSLGVIALPKTDESGPVRAVTSVAVDPSGRGLAAVAVVPKDSRRLGLVGLVDLRQRRILRWLSVGYHPDCVVFDPTGNWLVVANEGEDHGFIRRRPTPGSVSVIALGNYQRLAGELTVGEPEVRTVMLTDPDLLANLRIPHKRALEARHVDVEPEYISVVGDLAYVSLQENNAIGVMELSTAQWRRTFSLGRVSLTTDASDRDGAFGTRAIRMDDQVFGMPMPDGIAAFRVGRHVYVATANEGDPLVNDRDLMRVKRAGSHGPPLDRAYRERLKTRYGSDPLLDANLGRLQVSIMDGDVDGDGDLDELTMFGSRGFSIVEAATGRRVYDSGNLLERMVQRDLPGAFHMNRGRPARFDTRSDNRGAEVEIVISGSWQGRQVLFLAAERQNTLHAFDVSSPHEPESLAMIFASPHGHDSPETLQYLSKERSPGGRPLLLAGFEGSETLWILEVTEE